MSNRDPYREPGVVDKVFFGKEDNGILTCSVGISFTSSHQAFGNLTLDEATGADFRASLCDLFSVSKMGDIEGKEVVALRCFDYWSAAIEGLEVAGRRFVLTAWRRKHWPDQTLDPLEDAVRSARRSIASFQRRAEEEAEDLRRLPDRYRKVEG